MAKLIDRHLTPLGREVLDTFPVVVIEGARQVGKSTLAQILTCDRPSRHVTLDDEASYQTAIDDPTAFVTQAPEATLVIDEIQRAPRLLLAIKAEVDRNRRPGLYLVTGSSDLLALPALPDSLAGRAVTLRLGGFSQGEIAGVWDDFASWVRSPEYSPEKVTSKWHREGYVNALSVGSYPELLNMDPRMRALWLDSYLNRLLVRDLGELSTGLLANRVSEVLRLVAAAQGSELVPARIASDVGMPAGSVDAYLRALKAMHLTYDLPSWTPNLTSREISRRKVVVADSALAMSLNRTQTAALMELTASAQLGAELEAFVVAELTRQKGWSDADHCLYHFRDRNGTEVDIVIEYPDGTAFLLEIKASQTPQRTHAKGILTLAEALGPKFLGGAVLCLTQQSHLLGDRIWALPISVLWEHARQIEDPAICMIQPTSASRRPSSAPTDSPTTRLPL